MCVKMRSMIRTLQKVQRVYQEQPEYDSWVLEFLLGLYTAGFGFWLSFAIEFNDTTGVIAQTLESSLSVIIGVAQIVGVFLGRWTPAMMALIGAIWWAVLLTWVHNFGGHGAVAYNCIVLCCLNLSIVGKGRLRHG